MSIYVVDASVAAKWFFDEPLSDESARLLDPSHVLHVPDLFLIEIDSVLCKKIRRGEISEGRRRKSVLRWIFSPCRSTRFNF